MKKPTLLAGSLLAMALIPATAGEPPRATGDVSAVESRAAEVSHARLVREHSILVTNAAPFYAPGSITIRAGENVRWRSGRQSDTHSVREVLHGTFSLELTPGGEVSHRFKQSGEYEYRCRYHPWMAGRIVVEPRRLAIQWQPFPETLTGGRLVADDAGAFIVGPGAQPTIGQLGRGEIILLGALDERVRPEVTPEVDAGGSLWFSGESPGTLRRFSPLTRTTDAIPIATATGALTALAAAVDGTLWFHDPGSRRIGRLDPRTSGVSWLDADLSQPLTSMRAGTDGVIWVLDRSGRVGRLDAKKSDARISWTAPALGERLTVGRGAAWLLSRDRGKIIRVDGTGALLEFTVPPAIGSPAFLAPLAGGVWMMKDAGRVAQLVDGQIEEYELSPPGGRVTGMVATREELWLLDMEKHRIGHAAAEVRAPARLR